MSKQLTKDEVKHIAKLAKLALTSEELVKFQDQLSVILDYIDQLSQVNTSSVIPTSQITGLENVFREDTVKKSLTQKNALQNAPDQYQGFFKVKSVLK